MIEPEMAFCDLNGNMDLAEEFVKYLIVDAKKHCPTRWNFSPGSWTGSYLPDSISSLIGHFSGLRC
jgi:aspartyl/asparaginyl-tRNA synthetase